MLRPRFDDQPPLAADLDPQFQAVGTEGNQFAALAVMGDHLHLAAAVQTLAHPGYGAGGGFEGGLECRSRRSQGRVSATEDRVAVDVAGAGGIPLAQGRIGLHLGHHPEIELHGEAEASGRWTLHAVSFDRPRERVSRLQAFIRPVPWRMALAAGIASVAPAGLTAAF